MIDSESEGDSAQDAIESLLKKSIDQELNGHSLSEVMSQD